VIDRRLRVVAALDGTRVPAWLRHVLLDVVNSDVAELAAVVFTASPPDRRGRAFRAYEALDRRLFGQAGDPLERVDVADLLAGRPGVASPSEVRADVVLRLTRAALPAAWRSEARLGVWSFDHLDAEANGGAPFFWEMARGQTATETRLRAETAAGSRVLARSFAATDPTSLSRGRHAPLWKSAAFVGRALRDAARGAAPADAGAPPPSAVRTPGLLSLAGFTGRVALRIAGNRLRRATQGMPWFIALRPSKGSLVDGPMSGFVPVPMPGDRFYADPFLVPDGDRLWLFLEDADRASGKAVIRCAEVRPDGSLGASHVVIECDYHLSYPFVFQHAGAWFMLPETSGHRTVELWRAVEFPWHWKLDKVLFSGVSAVDATLLEHEGRLWLFAGMSESGGWPQDELFAFHADSLDGEWRPHARNPIVSDVRHARPAGPFFREGGRLYRPGQDCSGAYGAAFWIHRVERLDEEGYEETPVRRVETNWHPGLVATHTIQRAGGFDAIDGRLWWRKGRRFPG
jgi:hypothetical protein